MRISSFLLFLLFISACNRKSETNSPSPAQPVIKAADTAGNFFPVTSYLRGEIFNIKNDGYTPIRKISGSKDSSFIQSGDFQKVFADFLDPVIDTANLKSSFKEEKFKDETINSFTFTYDPLPGKENSFAFTHWDVYVDPETNKVKRIYLRKNTADGNHLQLTWQSGKWCKIVTLKDSSGTPAVVKEEKISWSYE